jgi:hypothetical protein
MQGPEFKPTPKKNLKKGNTKKTVDEKQTWQVHSW